MRKYPQLSKCAFSPISYRKDAMLCVPTAMLCVSHSNALRLPQQCFASPNSMLCVSQQQCLASSQQQYFKSHAASLVTLHSNLLIHHDSFASSVPELVEGYLTLFQLGNISQPLHLQSVVL